MADKHKNYKWFRIVFRLFIASCIFSTACESFNTTPSETKSVSKPNREIHISAETIFLSDLTQILQKVRLLEQEIDIATSKKTIDHESISSLFNTVVYPRLLSCIKMTKKLHPVTPAQVTVHQNTLSYLELRKTAATVVLESSAKDPNWLKPFNAHLDEAEKIAQQLRKNIAKARTENTNRTN